MKYCLSSRQTNEYLKKADEIFVKANDWRSTTDFFVDYPEATIYLEVPLADYAEHISWLKEANELADGKLILVLHDLSIVDSCKENGFKFCYYYPVSTWYDVQALITLGVDIIKITAPLTFQCNILTMYTNKVRFKMTPNVAYDAYIPRENGIKGQYVRPQDVSVYEEAIDVFEFEDANLEKERALYRIYAERKEWDGNINLLISNINTHADTRLFPEEFGYTRSVCGQVCMADRICNYCDKAFLLQKNLRNYYYESKQQENN